MNAHRSAGRVLLCIIASAASSAPAQQLDPCTTAGESYPVQSVPYSGQSSGVRFADGVFSWESPSDQLMPKPKAECPIAPSSLPLYDAFGWGKLAQPVANAGNIYSWVQWRSDLGYARGNRLQFNLAAAPAPGDFLSPAATMGDSSLALLPPGAAGASTAWNGISRPTLEGVVDLVTGVPLYRTVDLELPLDGAVFRLTRTRSANPMANLGDIAQHFDASDRWWSWVGEGWMAGENPLLLIDCNMPDMMGNESSPVTYLWLDAHHSIPFQQITDGNDRRYEAPARFRARMEHNGTWSGGVWNEPTQFDVWLYDGQVHYTFVAVRQDVPLKYYDDGYRLNQIGPMILTSYHDRPTYREEFHVEPPPPPPSEPDPRETGHRLAEL
jgi:hypothetical protein